MELKSTQRQASHRLCVVGDYAWDVLIQANSSLLQGGDSFGEVALAPGGSAANVAVWARRCGFAVDFVGKIGRDRFGQLAVEDLDREGVTAHLVASDAHLTGSVAVFVDPSGERSMVSGRGADFFLLASELPDSVVSAADHVHVNGWSVFTDPPRAAALRCAELAHRSGATVSFDPSSFQLIAESGVDLFLGWAQALQPNLVLPNFEEGKVLTGLTEPAPIARRLAELFVGATVVLKLDADGALVFHDGELTKIDPATDKLVDATGAGDSFAGAYLAHWLRARPHPGDHVAAARFATPVAAWVVEHLGARPRPDATLAAYLE